VQRSFGPARIQRACRSPRYYKGERYRSDEIGMVTPFEQRGSAGACGKLRDHADRQPRGHRRKRTNRYGLVEFEWSLSSHDSQATVVRLRAVRKETEEFVNGAVYAPPPGYYNFWSYCQAAYRDLYVTSSYLKENTIVRAEFNLYNTRDEKLLCNSESDTV
jgi:hypothetical protein